MANYKLVGYLITEFSTAARLEASYPECLSDALIGAFTAAIWHQTETTVTKTIYR